MKSYLLKFLFSLFLLAPLLTCFHPLTFAATKEELEAQIRAKNSELEQINSKIKSTQESLDATSARGKTLEAEVNRITRNIQNVDYSIKSSEVLIEKLGLEVQELQGDISESELAIQTKKITIARLLQNYQQTEGDNMLAVFLKGKSLAESLEEVQNISDLNTQLVSEIQDIQGLKTELASQLNQVSQKKVSTTKETQNLKAKREIIEDQRAERTDLLKETKSQEQSYQKMLSQLEQEQEAISNEIDKIEQQLRTSFDTSILPTKRSGILGYPVDNPYITQGYGATSFAQQAYKSGFHNGVDFRARPIGQPVYAAEDGFVKAAGNNGKVQYGRYIVIEHPNNLSSLYGHLSQQLVAAGDAVKRGQLIGYSGNTGYSFAPHLHFMVYWAPSVKLQQFPGAGLVPVGVTVNPLDYLPG